MNRRLNIKDIAVILAESTGKNSNDIELFLKELTLLMSEQIFIDKVIVVKGLGTFKIIPIEQRESIDVNTKERITIPGHYKLSFLPEKSLRETVNKPFSFFESIEINEDAAFAEMNTSSENERLIENNVSEEFDDATLDVEEFEEENIAPEEQKIEDSTLDKVIVENKAVTKAELIEEIIPEAMEQIASANESINVISSIEEEKEETPSEIIEEIKGEKENEIIQEENTVVEQTQITPDSNSNQKESILKVILSVLFVVLLAVIAIVGYMNRDLFFKPETNEVANKHPKATIEVAEPEPLKQETVPVESKTSQEVDVIAAEEKKTTEAPQKDNTTQQTNNKNILAKVKIQPGSRLTLLALEYYGSKIFWVYIYDYNKNIIKNPNHIPVGMEISIPNPQLYGIDSENVESIKKATVRQTELFPQ